MQDLIIPVNNEALSRALKAVVGDANTELVVKAYQLLDAAMIFGYEKGKSEAEVAADAKHCNLSYEKGRAQSSEDAWEAGYDKGFHAGASDCESADQCSYDDGYVAGVSDARVWPSFADEQVARLCQADEASEDTFEQDVHELYYDDFSYDFDELEPKLNAHHEGEAYDLDPAEYSWDDSIKDYVRNY